MQYSIHNMSLFYLSLSPSRFLNLRRSSDMHPTSLLVKANVGFLGKNVGFLAGENVVLGISRENLGRVFFFFVKKALRK